MNTAAQILNATRHFKSEVDVRKLGESKAEVCFLGRSNVGKSTLINAICQRKNLAHTSQVPGKTRTINVYEMKSGCWLVDLPGYGFAVGLKNSKDSLGKIIEGYLNDRENLFMAFVMIDAVAGPTKLDMTMITWLKHYSFPFSVIVSKVDKISALKLDERKKEIAAELVLNANDIFWMSSKNNIGIADLQKMIFKLLVG